MIVNIVIMISFHTDQAILMLHAFHFVISIALPIQLLISINLFSELRNSGLISKLTLLLPRDRELNVIVAIVSVPLSLDVFLRVLGS